MDILEPIPFVSPQNSISTCKEHLEQFGTKMLFLKEGDEFIGIVRSREIHEAMDKDLGSYSISIIAQNIDRISLQASSQTVQHKSSSSTCNALLVYDGEHLIGYTNTVSTPAHMSTQSFPTDWISQLDSNTEWLTKMSALADELQVRVYLVGGSVRDMLIGYPPLDLDFIIDGPIFPFVEALALRFGGHLQREQLFEAAHWTTSNDIVFDFTRARREHYPARAVLPSTQPGSIEDDLFRRDFTINAMAICIHRSQWGMLLDRFDGMRSLKAKELKVMHGLSFIDDPTRIIRAARYAARYHFKLEEGTKRILLGALSAQAGLDLSTERLGRELNKLFAEPNPQQAWNKLHEWGAIGLWLGNIRPDFYTVQQHWEYYHQRGMLLTPLSQSLWLCLSLSLSDPSVYESLCKHTKGLQKIWIQGPQDIETAHHSLLNAKDKGDWGMALQKSKPYHWPILLLLGHGESVDWWIHEGQSIRSSIQPTLLLELGCPRGPLLGQALQHAQRTAWNGGDRNEQKRAAQSLWIN